MRFRVLFYPVGISLLFTHFTLATKHCYAPDGKTQADHRFLPCIGFDNVNSMCCRLNDTSPDRCLENGLCQWSNDNSLWRGYCTDDTWDSPNCLSKIICSSDEEGTNSAHTQIIQCGKQSDNTYCCGSSPDCCKGNSIFTLDSTSDSTIKFPRATFDSSTTKIIAESHRRDAPSSKNIAIGVGVGVPLSLLAIAMLGIGFWWGKRHATTKDISGKFQNTETKRPQSERSGNLAPLLSNGDSPKTQQDFPEFIKTETRQKWHGWSESWNWEAAAATLSVIGLSLLVGFLLKIRNTPYADWQYTASPNAVVSTIVTISKASLLIPISGCLSQLKWNRYQDPAPLYYMQAIDQASRGPLGSLELLWTGIPRLRLDAFSLFGAFITILAVAVDPFAQQILAFPSRTVQVFNETASIQFAHEYQYEQKLYLNSYSVSLAPSLIGSIMSGLAQTSLPLEPECSSGSCKFSDFITLGICSQCTDITAKANQSCDKSESLSDIKPFTEIPAYCTYDLPNGLKTETDINGYEYYGKVMYNYWRTLPQNITSVPGIEESIFTFVAANQTVELTYTPKNITKRPPMPLFTDCAFYFCEKEYARSHYLANNRASHTLKVTRTQPLYPAYSTINIEGQEFYTLHPANGTTSMSSNSTYKIDKWTSRSLTDTMAIILNTTNEDPIDTDSNGLNLESILRQADLDLLLKSVSTSMTDTLRSNPKANSIPGKAFRVQTYIQVRWPWIIPLICSILGSITLLTGTAIATKRQHAKLWKASIIPLLLSRLDLSTENEIGTRESVEDIHHASKKTNVMMEKEGQYLVFKEQ